MSWLPVAEHCVQLIENELAKHACKIKRSKLLTCPCGHTLIALCAICRDPLLLVTHPDWPDCEHAREMLPYLVPVG